MFPTEQELVDRFKELSQPFLSALLNRVVNKYFLIDEFDCADGVADLVLGTFNPTHRMSKERKPIHLDWVYQLQRISSLEKISTSEFSDLFLISESTARKRIGEYVEAKYLKQIEGSCFKVSKPYKSALQFVVAIEAKRKNWSHALSQAYPYKKFSDLSFVMLDKDFAKPAIKSKEMFEKYNVGLVVTDLHGFEIIVRPTENHRKNDIYSSRVNEAAISSQWHSHSVK